MKTQATHFRTALLVKFAFLLLTALLTGLALTGCGPKDVGTHSSSNEEHGALPPPAEQMRYPMTGTSNTQRMLYYYNRPDVMNWQDLRISHFNRLTVGQPSPENPAYRAAPKQRSPFRQ
ncbi:hypothetical protein [uncultured Desulfovibrio sp.]|uniref:hypothetical protein n=1 Tax=uncultured Desulfovibrio sp. TaxID=167968 RepID=UPI0003B7A11A|nr:hypothetical protein [uncultured Desulfovibrio sp.]